MAFLAAPKAPPERPLIALSLLPMLSCDTLIVFTALLPRRLAGMESAVVGLECKVLFRYVAAGSSCCICFKLDGSF